MITDRGGRVRRRHRASEVWHPAPAAHHAGQYRYSTMTLLYPATGKTQTITLPSY